MYKQLVCATALLVSFSFSPVISAHSGNCGEGMDKMVQSMKLDESQKNRVKPILDQFKTTMKDYGAQMMDIHKQLNNQMMGANADRNNVDNLIDKKAAIIGNMMKAKYKAKMDIIAVLNDKQKTELQSKMKNNETKMADKFKDCHDDD